MNQLMKRHNLHQSAVPGDPNENQSLFNPIRWHNCIFLSVQYLLANKPFKSA